VACEPVLRARVHQISPSETWTRKTGEDFCRGDRILPARRRAKGCREDETPGISRDESPLLLLAGMDGNDSN